MQVKVFLKKKPFFENTKDFGFGVERDINNWLAANPGIKIREIRQSAGGGSFEPTTTMVSIWYENPADHHGSTDEDAS